MSQDDIQRFVADLKSDDALRAELSEKASGLASVVAFAAGKGYSITPDEVASYIQNQTETELTDAQLDAIAGGKGHHHHHHGSSTTTSTSTVQTTQTATTQTVEAETTVGAVAEVVAVVVLT